MSDPLLDPTASMMLAARASSSSRQYYQSQDASSSEAPSLSSSTGISTEDFVSRMEYSEMQGTVFFLAKTIRADQGALFDRVVEGVIVILAVLHSNLLSMGFGSIFVVAVLWLGTYLCSQVAYALELGFRGISLVRNRVDRERDKIKSCTLPVGSHKHSLVAEFEARETLTMVRLSSVELLFMLLRKILYLVVTYITYILVKALVDWITPNFSDGLWQLQKVFVLILIVIPFFVEFAVSSYHQDVVASAGHLKSD